MSRVRDFEAEVFVECVTSAGMRVVELGVPTFLVLKCVADGRREFFINDYNDWTVNDFSEVFCNVLFQR